MMNTIREQRKMIHDLMAKCEALEDKCFQLNEEKNTYFKLYAEKCNSSGIIDKSIK